MIIMQHETETGNCRNAVCDCIICAAGESNRMGEPKPLLPWGRSTLVETSVQAALAAGCRVILVTGANAGKVEELFDQKTNVISVRNEDWKKGMVSSIRCGAALVTSEYFFVSHADMPLVPSSVYTDLLADARREDFPDTTMHRVFRPRFEGVPGHPVLFGRKALPFIAALPDGESMKEFLGLCDLRFIDVDERGTTLDLDDPETYSAELAAVDLERAGRGILVLTGEKGTGKTTRIGRVYDRAAARKLNAVLVRQTETGRDAQGRATGFDMEMTAAYADGETERLKLPLARSGDETFDPVSRITLGPFVFDRAVFAWALAFVDRFIARTGKQERFIGLDEIGRLELERSGGLMPVLETAVAAVRKARDDGQIQHLCCSARLDTFEKLESFLARECLEADIQTLRVRRRLSRPLSPLS